MEVKEILMQLRKEAQLTQCSVAKGLGITQSAYSKYEKGSRSLTIELLEQICKFYSIDFVEFFSVGREKEPIRKKVQITLEANNQEQLDKINQILNSL